MKPLRIALEGSIGSGKSTIIRKLNLQYQNKNIVGIIEPDELWRTSGLLKDFYNNQRTYVTPLQTFISATFLLREINLSSTNAHIIISERSLDSAEKVFLPMLIEDAVIDKSEFDVISRVNRDFNGRSQKVDLYIFLTTDPTECFNNIQKRDRQGENKIELTYLQNIDLLHRKWMKTLPDDKVLQLSTSDQDFELLEQNINLLLRMLAEESLLVWPKQNKNK